jgi:aminopeptidase N
VSAKNRAPAAAGAATSADPYLPEHGNGGYCTEHYDLTLEYRASAGRLSGRASIRARATMALTAFSLDLGPFRVDRVRVNDRAARYSHGAGKLRVKLAEPLAAGQPFTVDVRYLGVPQPVRSRWGELGWEQLEDGALVASQPVGAPSWFPCNDHPSDKATYRFTVTAASPLTVVATGELVSRHTGAGSTTWVYDLAVPTPTYLAAVQIGPYQVSDLPGSSIPQRAAVPARLRTEFAHDFARQDQIMAAFEEIFGPYPFPSYTIVVVDEELEVPIEAQGMSVFGRNHVDGRRTHERFVAHELAHQWFGNSLTVASWRHIWLNEGFASYSEWLWSELSGGEAAAAHAARWRSRLAALPQDLLVADPGVRRMFDDRLYRRGALTLHALRTTVGDQAFFAILREWTATHRHASVTTEQFVALAQRHTPIPLGELISAWLLRPALP